MPVVLEDPELRDPLRDSVSRAPCVQTSVLYPAIHEFSAYAGEAHAPLPQSEFVARAELTLPLYPDLAEADQDRVIVAFRETLAELAGSDAGQAAGA